MAEAQHSLYVVRAVLADCTDLVDQLDAVLGSAEAEAKRRVPHHPWSPSGKAA